MIGRASAAAHRTPEQYDSHDPGFNFPALRQTDPKSVESLKITHDGNPGILQLGAPTRFMHTKVRLPLADLPAALVGFRVLHLSDLHLRRRWSAGYDRLIERLKNDPPDVLLFTGDFVQDRFNVFDALETVRRLLPQLRARLGVFGILGNHDPDLLLPYLRPLNVTMLMQQRLVLRSEQAAVELIGLPGLARCDLDPEWIRSMPPRQPGVPRIVMAHYPDLLAPAQALHADLYLCGHTHGGQIALPNRYPLMTHDGLPKRFARGLHRIGPTWVNVSCGFGYTTLPIRAFSSPEVTEFELGSF